MDNFQKYLDDALKKVDILEEEPIVELPGYDIFAEISALIVDTRNEIGITQKELAKKSGLTQANISKIESGACRPTIESLKKIADGLGKRLVINLEEKEDTIDGYDS